MQEKYRVDDLQVKRIPRYRTRLYRVALSNNCQDL